MSDTTTRTEAKSHDAPENRWRGRPVLGLLLRLVIGLVPIAVSVVSGALAGHLLEFSVQILLHKTPLRQNGCK